MSLPAAAAYLREYLAMFLRLALTEPGLIDASPRYLPLRLLLLLQLLHLRLLLLLHHLPLPQPGGRGGGVRLPARLRADAGVARAPAAAGRLLRGPGDPRLRHLVTWSYGHQVHLFI